LRPLATHHAFQSLKAEIVATLTRSPNLFLAATGSDKTFQSTFEQKAEYEPTRSSYRRRLANILFPVDVPFDSIGGKSHDDDTLKEETPGDLDFASLYGGFGTTPLGVTAYRKSISTSPA
jgi:hypothetical protein